MGLFILFDVFYCSWLSFSQLSKRLVRGAWKLSFEPKFELRKLTVMNLERKKNSSRGWRPTGEKEKRLTSNLCSLSVCRWTRASCLWCERPWWRAGTARRSWNQWRSGISGARRQERLLRAVAVRPCYGAAAQLWKELWDEGPQRDVSGTEAEHKNSAAQKSCFYKATFEVTLTSMWTLNTIQPAFSNFLTSAVPSLYCKMSGSIMKSL